MKKKIFMIAAAFALVFGCGMALAWNAGFCQKAGCYCHQYYGNGGACFNCGHAKAAHS
jgi:hypothetical protein